MSLLIQAYLLERYGPRLTLDQLAEALSMAKNSIYNQVRPTYVDGRKRYADYRDVAGYFDECRATATTAVAAGSSWREL